MWQDIPPIIKPFFHFFNIAISTAAGKEDRMSPLWFIKQVAKVEDFVAFKLGNDAAEVEIPLVLDVLKFPAIANLIDEFFYQLRIHNEIPCAWSKQVPKELKGLVLDRTHALDLFRSLREAGIRAHVWP